MPRVPKWPCNTKSAMFAAPDGYVQGQKWRTLRMLRALLYRYSAIAFWCLQARPLGTNSNRFLGESPCPLIFEHPDERKARGIYKPLSHIRARIEFKSLLRRRDFLGASCRVAWAGCIFLGASIHPLILVALSIPRIFLSAHSRVYRSEGLVKREV